MHRPVSGDFLQWLRTFTLVAETLSIHRAAAILCISPSAASHHIRKLEQDLGQTLFERVNTGMKLTHDGILLKEKSLPVLETVESLRVGKAHTPALRGLIRLTCVNRFAHHLMPDVLSFKTLHPGVAFNIEPTSPARVFQNIEQGAADLGISIHRQLPAHLDFQRLCKSSAALFTAAGNPFNLPPKPSWDQICELPFIALTIEGYVNPVLSLRPELRQPENIVVAINDFLLAMQMVKVGMGVCIATPLTPLETAAEYTTFSLDHLFPLGDFGIFARRDSYLSLQTRAFAEHLKKLYQLREQESATTI